MKAEKDRVKNTITIRKYELVEVVRIVQGTEYGS